jgi:membrane-associated phospholipid phosphatase
MKRQNRFTKTDLLLTLLPALFWLGATHARPWVIRPSCSQAVQTCSKESVISVDRLSLGMEDSQADEFSYFTQNFSGFLALAVPAAWNLSLLTLGQVNAPAALTALGTDLVVVLQTTFWNGFLTETSHLISQRPRPFVYSNPAVRGTDPAHYTSFYSGHTSFTAAANTVLLILLFLRRAPLPILLIYGAVTQMLIFSTAYFRILAGRHFLTDVIFGAIAGSLIALIISYYHRSKYKLPTLS